MPPRPIRDTMRYLPTVWPTMEVCFAPGSMESSRSRKRPARVLRCQPDMAVLLSEKDVRAVLPMADLIAAMETALERLAAGGARQPLRTVVDAGGHGFYGVMPAYLE